jgi:phosphoribosyl 1,2-cyclic phosphodiesterase
MARFCPLFSSSSGNCTYIGCASGGILIDVGVSAKRTREALFNIGVDMQSIGAIFVTHEHTDHIQGLRVLAGSHGFRVYTSEGPLTALEADGHINGKVNAAVIPETRWWRRAACISARLLPRTTRSRASATGDA